MKRQNTENKFRNVETAQKVNAVLKASKLDKLYTVAYNENTDRTNKTAQLNAEFTDARKVVESMKLSTDFIEAVQRFQVWLDSTQIVVFVGAVFAVYARLAVQKDAKKLEKLEKLFTESLDKKYNERKLRNKKITALTETRHTFETVESYTEFINTLSDAIAERVTAERAQQKAQKEQKAEQKEQKAKKQSTKQKTQQKAQQKEQKAQ